MSSKVVYVNSNAQFPMIDAIAGTRFVAGDAKKVEDNAWIKSQVENGVLFYSDADGAALGEGKAPAEKPEEAEAEAKGLGKKPAP